MASIWLARRMINFNCMFGLCVWEMGDGIGHSTFDRMVFISDELATPDVKFSE